jgi:hypothetical protein
MRSGDCPVCEGKGFLKKPENKDEIKHNEIPETIKNLITREEVMIGSDRIKYTAEPYPESFGKGLIDTKPTEGKHDKTKKSKR